MKALLTLMMVAVLGVSAYAQTAQSADSKAATTTSSTGGMQQIGKEEFLVKVYNYEKSTWWRFEGTRPCIIDFHADWCGPCRTLSPVLDDLAKKYSSKIDVYKIDTEKEKDLVRVFGIKSLPTLLFCPIGGKPQVVSGALPSESIEKVINDVLIKSVEDANRPKKQGW